MKCKYPLTRISYGIIATLSHISKINLMNLTGAQYKEYYSKTVLSIKAFLVMLYEFKEKDRKLIKTFFLVKNVLKPKELA